MAKSRMLLVAAVGATSGLLFGCPKVYGNPKAPPPDSAIDAPSHLPDAARDGGVDAAGPLPDAHVTVTGSGS
jgi:hypothetical protein